MVLEGGETKRYFIFEESANLLKVLKWGLLLIFLGNGLIWMNIYWVSRISYEML